MNFVFNSGSQVDANYETVMSAITAGGHCLHAFDSNNGDRLDRMELWALNGQIIAVYRHFEASGRGAKRSYSMVNFEVLRPMGADNKMDTVLREIAWYPRHPLQDASDFLDKAIGIEG